MVISQLLILSLKAIRENETVKTIAANGRYKKVHFRLNRIPHAHKAIALLHTIYKTIYLYNHSHTYILLTYKY